ncbi:hypothetical protein C8F04DRAFT_1227472 [Mycena alexandri]|uniref:Zn(2)-C6 fungal-type domain-containing protein n=1 Tax=Mycena alexandri TaxID=1745969 RepID=A0AAD6TIJ4_9AGAR|nr:hypothetical protein C8F04DRAFT_1227472 [Mycena alexandri]
MPQTVRPKRTRVYIACTACRARKSRCISDQYENKPCERCVRKDLRCEYVPVSDGGEESASPTGPMPLPRVSDGNHGAHPAHTYDPGPRSGAGPQYRSLASRFEAASPNTNPGVGGSLPPTIAPQPRTAPGVAVTYYTPPREYQPGPPPAQYNNPVPARQHSSPAYHPQYDHRLLSFPPPPARPRGR